MASLFSSPPEHYRVLDPGAGSGILSAAICDRIQRLSSPRVLHVDLFETDKSLLAVLRECMNQCRDGLRASGHKMTFEIHDEDFVLAHAPQTSLFGPKSRITPYDAIIMNPPYFKIAGDSDHARAMANVVYGQPNIYALFMALGAELLHPGGEMVAITPRSFCNGPYFRGFRRWFFDRMSLERVHLFESRTDTFREANVLQESIITSTRKHSQSPNVTVSTSFGQDVHSKVPRRELPAPVILDNAAGEMYVRIPEDPQDSKVLALVESWPHRFNELGLRVSTGPVVAFRARPFLLAALDGAQTVPLLSVHNVRPFETVWPLEKGKKPTAFTVAPESQPLLLLSKNYVLLRRFTAKEEHRRLVASCYLKKNAVRPFVALENHLNYVYHTKRELTEAEAFGLMALFNSALLDRYFRAISGNTQVNATELRSMPLPDLVTVARIGARIQGLESSRREDIEAATLDELGITATIRRYLSEHIH
jgi:adenine-specific DNA-methyltransferase